MPDPQTPSFNLWTDPWIPLEKGNGGIETVGIQQVLLQAAEYRAIYDPSPLVVVGIQRLLVAILQFALMPEKNGDLKKLWRAGRFPREALAKFGQSYAHRFNLFSEKEPFLQSADLPLAMGKNTKPVAYLAPEVPAGTAITHYRHGVEDEQVFCPACAARGLMTIPAFSTSGGAGIKPSINGVPPIYILPGGGSLFESLTASLICPEWQPQIASRKKDDVWWVRKPVVGKGVEVREVGYLHSLTFPARRIRLYPEQLDRLCSRCNAKSLWMVRKMIFEMGESRPKSAEFWFDPFAAYRIDSKKGPIPIRPNEGKATWREFTSLFLRAPADGDTHTQRPRVLDQIADLELDYKQSTYPFRCVGLRTDMKAKVFEWVEAGFDVPPAMLRDESAGPDVRDALDFAAQCGRVIGSTFRQYFGGKARKSERQKALRIRMENTYWSLLSDPFRRYVLKVADLEQRPAAHKEWGDTVLKRAHAAFQEAMDSVGDDAEGLSQRAVAEKWCNIRLVNQRKEYLDE